MENLINFLATYGVAITIIAIAGIVILGVLKYCNLFKKIAENKRHYIYLAISIGFSVLATLVYLLIVKQFEIGYFLTIAAAIYALNQTFYNIFKVTSINKLATKILDFVLSFIKKKIASNGGNPAPPDNENNKE